MMFGETGVFVSLYLAWLPVISGNFSRRCNFFFVNGFQLHLWADDIHVLSMALIRLKPRRDY